MTILAFFAGIFLTAAVAILIVRGAKAPHADEVDWLDCRAGLPPLLRESPIKPTELDADRMRSLSVRMPARDADFWDIANHEPEPGCVEYRFLGITGFEDD